MEAKMTILNYGNMVEKEFDLPYNEEEMDNFFLGETYYESEVVDVEDKYNFLMKIEAYKYNKHFINELVELIEESNKIEETILKLEYYFDYISSDIEYIIKNFKEILDKLDLYKDIRTSKDWVEVHNTEYNFVDLENWNDIKRHFNYDLRDYFLRDCFATYGFSENDIDRYYKMDMVDIIDEFVDIGLSPNFIPFISNYIDWENIVNELKGMSFYVEEIKNSKIYDCVITHQHI